MGSVINKAVKASTFGAVDLEPKTPKPPGVEPMPTVDDRTAQRAKERALQRRRRSGRTSTVLTGESNTLG
jgi:hypothetical protein